MDRGAVSRRTLLHGAALLALLPDAAAWAQAAQDTPLPRIDDLRPLLATVKRERRPLLLFFTTPGCPYCREVRRSYLRPRAEEGEAARGVLIREVEMTSDRELVDLNGQVISERALAARYRVTMVPHLEFVDGSGKPLVKPLIGINRAGFYEGLLQQAILESTRAQH